MKDQSSPARTCPRRSRWPPPTSGFRSPSCATWCSTPARRARAGCRRRPHGSPCCSTRRPPPAPRPARAAARRRRRRPRPRTRPRGHPRDDPRHRRGRRPRGLRRDRGRPRGGDRAAARGRPRLSSWSRTARPRCCARPSTCCCGCTAARSSRAPCASRARASASGATRRSPPRRAALAEAVRGDGAGPQHAAAQRLRAARGPHGAPGRAGHHDRELRRGRRAPPDGRAGRPGPRVTLPPSEHRAPLEALGLEGPALGRLAAYLDTLAAWSPRVNLTGARTPIERVRWLVADVVAAAHLPAPGRLIDVGSGNGTPGLVLALAPRRPGGHAARAASPALGVPARGGPRHAAVPGSTSSAGATTATRARRPRP